MKKLLIILIFIPILAYSQNIGETMPESLLKTMRLKATSSCNLYTSFVNDSMTVIGASLTDGRIFSIDYVFREEKVANMSLNWVKKHKLVGRNVYYDSTKQDFYFIVYLQGLVYIQIRNVRNI